MQNFKKDQQIPLVQVTDPNTGQTYYAPQNVVYDEKNNNGPQYLRNVIVDQATTASYFSGSITNAVSASYALTASYALNGGGGGETFPYTGSARITGSLIVTGSITATGGFTGSFSGSVAAPGATTQVVFNNGGVLGADSGFVYSGSRVGIGKATPTQSLDVNGDVRFSSVSGSESVQIKSNSLINGDFAELLLTTSTANNSYKGATIRAVRGIVDKLSFSVANSSVFEEKMALFSNGNLLIQNGGTFTDAGYRLDVKGSTRIQGTGTTSATTALRIENANASASLIVLDNGNVGIGTATPFHQLVVNGDTGLTINSSGIVMPNLSRVSSDGGLLIRSYNSSSNTFTNNVKVNPNGNVGIGTIIPSASLHISGAASSTLLQIDSPTSSSILFVTGSGNVGIGTNSPDFKLHVVNNEAAHVGLFIGNIRPYGFAQGAWGSALYLGKEENGSNQAMASIIGAPISEINSLEGYLAFSTRNLGTLSTRMYIDNTGNVGIGTSSPIRTLSALAPISIAVAAVFGGTSLTPNWVGIGTAESGSSPYIQAYNNAITATTKLSLNSVGGNVLVGTTTDIGGKLSVRGTGATSGTTAFRVENSNSTPSLVVLDHNSVAVNASFTTQKFQVNGPLTTEYSGTDVSSPGDIMNILGSGSAARGLGTGSALLFSVPANTDGTNFWAQARILGTGDNSSSGNADGAMFLQTRSSYNPGVGGTWNWRTNMVLRASGNVGIGTKTPSASLDVSGSGRFTNGLTVTGSVIATSFTGSIQGTATTASNITPAITNNVDNRILTATGGGTINGESNLTFNGTDLTLNGNLNGVVTSGMRPFQTNMYFDLHPEGSYNLIPFYSNDLAYTTLRGGSISASFGPGSTQTLSTANALALFDGASTYCAFSSVALSGSAQFTITFPQTFNYGNTIGFSFGNTTWAARDFTVEILVTGSYVTLDTQTNYAYANYSKVFNTSANGVTGARITFSNFATTFGFRIAEIFLLNYNSQLGKAVFMGRDGGAVYSPITIQSGSTSAPSYASLTDTNTGIYFPAADTLGFVEGGTEVMRINSSGQVGIGTTSQTAQLHISGASSAALLRVGSPASSSILFVSGSGQIGVGTSSPTASLHIVDQGTSLVNSLLINTYARFRGDGVLNWGPGANTGGGTGILTWDTNRAVIGGLGSSVLDLVSNGASGVRIRIDTSGNAGLGTGTGTISSRLQVKGSGATSATTALRVENTNASASLVVLDDGTVGVGTSTTSRTLQVNGSFRVNRTNQTFQYWDLETGEANFGRLRHISDSNNQKGLTISNILSGATPAGFWNFISLEVQNGEALRIDAARNIGIGTISPSASLDVSGSGRFTNGLTVTGSLRAPSITGSLLGTASYATTAAYALDHAPIANTYICNGYLIEDQTFPTGSDEIIRFESLDDPNGWITSHQFIPTVAGYYHIDFGVWLANPGATTNQVNVQVRKNGSTYMILQQPLNNSVGQSLAGSKLIYLDGSTDYLDFTVFQSIGSSATGTILQGTPDGSGTWFSAFLVTQ